MNKVQGAFQLRKKLKALELAKLNAERARLGLPPKRPCCEDLCINCSSWARDFCLEACFPCCFASSRQKSKYWKQQLVYQKSPFRRLFIRGTYENEVLGNVFGFLFGLFLTIVSYFVMVFVSGYNGKIAMSFAIAVGSVLSLGLAFSSHIRCIVFLIIPQIFSKQGRYYVMFYTMILILQGPADNATRNLEIISETMTCLQETIYKEALEGLENMESPLGRILYPIYKLVEHLKSIVHHIKSAFKAVKAVFKGILTTFKSIGKFLKNIVFTCDAEMKKPFRNCISSVKAAITDCKKKGFGSVCDVSHVASGFCHVTRVGEFFCKMLKTVKQFFKRHIGDKLTKAINAIKHQFRVGVSFNRHFNNTLVAKTSFHEIWIRIKKDIEERAHWITQLASITQYASIIGIVYIVIKALVYRKLYLVKDNWDNHYITSDFREIDERREEMELETLLPLHTKESFRYIRSASPRMTRRERRILGEGLLAVGAALTQGLYYMCLDWGTFYSVQMFRDKAVVNMDDFVDDDVVTKVAGHGIMASVFRSILQAFDPIKEELKRVDIDKCLPTPSHPDLEVYKRICILWIISVILAFLSAYVLRTKHCIMAHFYPDRERERAVWMYNAILRDRGGLTRWLRRNLRRRKILGTWEEETMGGGYNLTFWDRVIGSCPWTRHPLEWCGYKRQSCVACATSGKPDDRENFTVCPNGACQAVYCVKCFVDVGKVCVLCSKPIDYGDLSDDSEEVDSSDEEDGERVDGGEENNINYKNNREIPLSSTSDESQEEAKLRRRDIVESSNHSRHRHSRFRGQKRRDDRLQRRALLERRHNRAHSCRSSSEGEDSDDDEENGGHRRRFRVVLRRRERSLSLESCESLKMAPAPRKRLLFSRRKLEMEEFEYQFAPKDDDKDSSSDDEINWNKREGERPRIVLATLADFEDSETIGNYWEENSNYESSMSLLEHLI